MLISHEVPFCLLEQSRTFNDYDYSLVHLFENNPHYFDFYAKSLAMGRTVILDNSVFELGTAFNSDRYAYWIDKLKPTEYIIPDVLGDSDGTIKACEDWISDYDDLPGKKIGVVQAATIPEAIECFQLLSSMVDKIAIGFNYKFYSDICPDANKLVSWMRGRQYFIDMLMQIGLVDGVLPWHLLGCSYMREFQYYQKGYDFIETCDTSNPIVFSLVGVECDINGMDEKISTKLVDYMDVSIDNINMDLLHKNVNTFRSFHTNQG